MTDTKEITNSNKPVVSIVMLMHNITPWLVECSRWCFKSIMEHTVYPSWELIVVDNASTASGWEELNASFRKQGATIIRHETNLGMTGGFNSAIELCSGEFIFFIENDVVVTNFWVTNALKCFAENPKVALIKAVENDKIRDESVKEEEQDQEKRYETIQDSNHEWLKKYAKGTPHNLDDEKTFGIDAWTSLWCCAFRKSALKDIDGYFFDEKIGLNWDEDMDVIWRLRDANWSTVICYQMYVHHRASQTCSLKGEYAASPEKEAGRQHFWKKHDCVFSEHGWATRRKNRAKGEAQGHTYRELAEIYKDLGKSHLLKPAKDE